MGSTPFLGTISSLCESGGEARPAPENGEGLARRRCRIVITHPAMHAPESNHSLRPLLRAWQVSPPVDPGFRSAIWARIERAREWTDLTWAGYLRHHLLAWVLVLGFVAGGAGWWGRSAGALHSADDRELVLASYVAAIDARAMEP